MIFFLAYLHVHYVIFLPSTVMHMHIKLMNSFGNWLITSTLSSCRL